MGGKKKRQETALLSASSSLRSSSYRQDSGSPATSTAHQNNHVKTVNVGCMSGIFHLMSKYHTRRKFLTFGRKHERNAIVHAPTTPPPPEKNPPPKSVDTITCHTHEQGSSAEKLALDQAPRSPAIPAEIRRSSADSSTSSPRVVARLMGLDEIPATSPTPERAVSAAAEKRRKLLGALEKCDEDLQALKKIIEAVRATQTPLRVVETNRREVEVEEVESEVGSDEPSPVSVLDHHHLSTNHYQKTPNEKIMQQQQKPKQKQHVTRKKPGDHEDKAINLLNKPTSSNVVTTTPQPIHLPARTTQQLFNAAATASITVAPWSTAMKESVTEVCTDVEWGQRQEVGRTGLLLQDLILRALIDEIIKELASCNHVYSTPSSNLPFEACKKKLSF